MSTDTRSAIDFGISLDDLREQVIARATEQLVDRISQEDYAHLDRVVQGATDAAVAKYIETVIVPLVATQIETITFQATNKWGEKKGQAVTFREYLIERAEAWLREEVDHQGKEKGRDSFGWHAHQTRVAHMIHEHLHYTIASAIQEMLKTANAQIVGGIQDTVKLKLAEIQTALTVKTDAKRK